MRVRELFETRSVDVDNIVFVLRSHKEAKKKLSEKASIFGRMKLIYATGFGALRKYFHNCQAIRQKIAEIVRSVMRIGRDELRLKRLAEDVNCRFHASRA